MAVQSHKAVAEHRLTVPEVLGMLVADGLVDQADAEALIAEVRLRRMVAHPLAIIAEEKWKSLQPPFRPLTLDELGEWFAARVGLEYFHIDPLKVDFTSVTDVVSSAYATRFGILAVKVTASEVVFATTEPFLREWEKEIESITKKRIRRVIANPIDVARYLVEFYNLARSVKKASQMGNQSAGLSSFEQLVELGRSNRQFDANDQHIVNIVDWLWQYAFEQRASDIHIEPRRDMGLVRFRIDGLLHQVYQMPMSVLSAMTSRIKILGRMDVVEKRRPQDGRIKTRVASGKEVELRLSTLPTAFGEKLVMRIFDPDATVKDLAALGFSATDAPRWESLTKRPHGIILVTGPTGSGKTTTLYATLKRLATEEVNVSTVEDPIEMIEPAFNQTQVQPHLDLDFAQGLRSLMRQDPDIIMVGEIRDLPTAEMAVQAALTGHLVFSTLHTNDAPSAIMRLMELGIPPYLINATVLGVLAQRLVRTLCPSCKVQEDEAAAAASLAAMADLVKPWQISGKYRPYQPVGCVECRMTGYRGRTGLYELLTVSEAFKDKVNREPRMETLRRQGVTDGMRPLRLAGAARVAEGLTTLDEVLASTPPVN